MISMEKLPKYFVIKCIVEHPLWDKYIDWLNEKYKTKWNGTIHNYYYGYDGNIRNEGGTKCAMNLSFFENNPTLITLEEWDECINVFKLPEKWCVKDCKKVTEWALQQFKFTVDEVCNDAYLCINQNEFPGYLCYRFLSIECCKEYGYTEITFEQFQKHVLKQKNNMIDFRIKGTKLPIIPAGTKYRCIKWGTDTGDYMTPNYLELTSFGFKEHNGDIYILCDNPIYSGTNYYMIKESDIIKLAKEQNMINEQKRIIGYKAPYDLFGGNIKANTVYKPIASKNNIVYTATIDDKVVDGGQTNMPKEIVETWEPVYEEYFKKGDWVYWSGNNPVIGQIKSGPGWGGCYQLSGKYERSHDSLHPSHLRHATEEEIKSVTLKELYFGNVKFTIKKDQDFATTEYGEVYKSDIKKAIDYIENPPRLITYDLTIHVNGDYSVMNGQEKANFKIGFGCKSGTLNELKEILKAFD